MTLSYNWLSDYLPVSIDPQKLSAILTSIGLEVEKMELFEEVQGGLKDLVIGEVLEVQPHPNADKLKLTRVDIGNNQPLQIVCGAPNVATGQKVVVAPVGATIYPASGSPLTMKLAKIRGEESQGMICAEDEIGLGTSHAGIMVLNENAKPGSLAADYFKPYTDMVYEIGLTPNRMDAMSHWGVARDVCAYLSHHEKKVYEPKLPSADFKIDNHSLPIQVTIETPEACRRYSGVCMAHIVVKESPKWLQQRLKAIGIRAINNIVDVTNYIQHETGQPLHAFNYDAIKDEKVIVKTLPEGTPFVTLDEKERKLSSKDLMICNADAPMCIAGVFGGLYSGVTDNTTNIFLESAWFDPVFIRKTSFRHALRTDAAMRFEKGVDISNTVTILKRAALLIKEIAGGEIASDIQDIYPAPVAKKQVALSYAYLKKLSGKTYPPATVKTILKSLGFTIINEDAEGLQLEVPYHKTDISIPADIVEEVVRIDGLDNIAIPQSITITPSVEKNNGDQYKEKIAAILTGCGFTEILTNSLTNSKYYTETQLQGVVRLLNNISVELDIMRPSMLHTALEVISFNNNRKATDLKFFEFGKTYQTSGVGQYTEQNHLCLYVTGSLLQNSWKQKSQPADMYYLKGIAEAVLQTAGISDARFEITSNPYLQTGLAAISDGEALVTLGQVAQSTTAGFDIKQPVFFADFNWDILVNYSMNRTIRFKEIPKFPTVERDLAIVIPKQTPYEHVADPLKKLRIPILQHIKVFDVFESDKLGSGKKSLAINFTFLDVEKTLTDKEIDGWMQKIMASLEKELGAEIRK